MNRLFTAAVISMLTVACGSVAPDETNTQAVADKGDSPTADGPVGTAAGPVKNRTATEGSVSGVSGPTSGPMAAGPVNGAIGPMSGPTADGGPKAKGGPANDPTIPDDGIKVANNH
jgi:hypothetical protein